MKNYWLKRNIDKDCNRKWSRIEIMSRMDSWLYADHILEIIDDCQIKWDDKPFDFGSTESYKSDVKF